MFNTKGKKQSENVVIITLQRLGDAIFTIPALKNIIDYHKNNIFIICFEELVPIYQLVFTNINFIILKRSEFSFSNRIVRSKDRKTIKSLNPSIIYDMTGDTTSASLIFNASSNKIVGINEPYYRSIYSHFHPIRTGPHMVDIYLDGVSTYIPVKYYNPNLNSENSEKNQIYIHPFASNKAREWGLNRFIKLADNLNREFNCSIVCQPDTISLDVKHELSTKQIKLIETKNTKELIDVLRSANLFIGNDSGPAHIANLLGIPTFTIFGPTDPIYVKPLNGKNQYIYKILPCSTKQNNKWCFTHGGLFCPSNECMKIITVEEVLSGVLNFYKSLLNV